MRSARKFGVVVAVLAALGLAACEKDLQPFPQCAVNLDCERDHGKAKEGCNWKCTFSNECIQICPCQTASDCTSDPGDDCRWLCVANKCAQDCGKCTVDADCAEMVDPGCLPKCTDGWCDETCPSCTGTPATQCASLGSAGENCVWSCNADEMCEADCPDCATADDCSPSGRLGCEATCEADSMNIKHCSETCEETACFAEMAGGSRTAPSVKQVHRSWPVLASRQCAASSADDPNVTRSPTTVTKKTGSKLRIDSMSLISAYASHLAWPGHAGCGGWGDE